MPKKSIALITSLKTKTFKFRFKCFLNIIYYSILSLVFLVILDKTKNRKFSKKVREIITYKTPKIYGHEGVSGKHLTPHCAIAGNPAKKVKAGITWNPNGSNGYVQNVY